jgi:hypothetical protein
VKSIKDTLLVIQNVVEQFNKEAPNKAIAALIGGYAAIYFGAARTTFDVDLCLYLPDVEPGKLFHSYLKKVLPKRFTLRFLRASKDPLDPLGHDLIVIYDSENEYPRIDILMARYKWELKGLEQAHPSEGLSFPVMPVPTLITMKLLAGGRKDDLDILDMLKEISEEDLQETHKLAKTMGKDKKLRSLLKEIKKR